ncbi:class III lanthionine synthetase LanKC [Streptomyces caniferus]|uniref:class III lanthionine synthetase LanKC n=1 Tax=Streptomyces caniferus TaxID=285557 RepID=UPI0033D86CB7
MDELAHALGDGIFYVPAGTPNHRGTSYVPEGMPADWRVSRSGMWHQWRPESGHAIADQGWKVHVSAQMQRASHVLDTVARICAQQGVVFKHLASSFDFLVMHHKHASRIQSGKFIAAYPADAAAALKLMRALAAALAGEKGPYILTDLPFEGSECVFYRYGAFKDTGHVLPDGSFFSTVKDASGREIPDDRRIGAGPPPGITDPFRTPAKNSPARLGAVTVGGYTIERVVRFSNSGGTYRAVEQTTGRTVFLKEARPHSGLVSPHSDAQQRLHGERRALEQLHRIRPGLCPEPIDFFTEGGHCFLVSEFVAGKPLHSWVVEHNPVINSRAEKEDFTRYFAVCKQLLGALRAQMQELHDAGYAFIDLGPDNVMVTADGTPRLVDFETVGLVQDRPTAVGAPGFFDPELAEQRPLEQDEHALASIALYLLAPVNVTADRNPAVLGHLRFLLEQVSPLPPALWAAATRRSAPLLIATAEPPVAAESVCAEPRTHLEKLRRDLIKGILATADPGGTGPLFPTVPEGFASNTLSVQHGAAGVLHALSHADVPVPESVRKRFLRDAFRQRDALPPGLFSGLAGISWVLTETGHLEEAAQLLDAATRHPVLDDCVNLAHGAAGVAMAHLRFHVSTGEFRHLDRAKALLDGIGAEGESIGLAVGASGVAMAHYYLGTLTGDTATLAKGRGFLETDRRLGVLDHGGLLFPVSSKDRRLMPYLWGGSAGIGLVANRYLSRETPDLKLLIQGTQQAARCLFTRYGGLFQGLSGLGAYWADTALWSMTDEARQQALDIATRLFLHTVPTPDGTYLHGGPGLRLSCDLGSGSAGVLLFLHQLLHGKPDALFTLDAFVGTPSGAGADAHREAPVLPPDMASDAL